MRRALRACMVGLVLVSLAFVQTTEAARWTWLLPLLALTIASPWLVRLTKYMGFRIVWNLSVLGVFALLVRHVTTAGVAFLLEDGLLLAALCQVHLVNNLSDAQKPDLLFFNSFLIAVVTSFLSIDLGYSVVLIGYAPLLVVSMQLLTLSRAGVADADGLVVRVMKSGLLRGGALLALTLLAFLFVPRDFTRRGLLRDTLRLAPPGGLEVAFSDRVDLEQSGQVQVSARIVMTVKSSDGTPPPPYWRGAALDVFDGRGWRASRGITNPHPWCGGKGVWTRSLPGNGKTLEVYLVDPEAQRLFAPLESRRLEEVSADLDAAPQTDGTFRRTLMGRRRPVQYTVELSDPRTPGGATGPEPPRAHSYLDPRGVPRAARDLARRLRKDIAPGTPQFRIVQRFRDEVASRDYLPPGAEGAAGTLAEFLERRAGAHCEYFATALAVLLRLNGIPCRVVTGYRSEETDANGVLTVRAQHAHAWVEVLDPEAGWMTVDPTPAAAAAGDVNGGILASVRRAAERLWAAVSGFNADARQALFLWVAALPGRIARNPGDAALFVVALALVILALRVRRLRREEPHARAYRRSLRRLKLGLAPGETPRELVERARRTAYPRDRFQELAAATCAHERARYGG